MYHHLRGKVVSHGAAHAVVECAGVGYRVLVTPATAERLRPGAEATLLTHHDVGEDHQRLFGFLEETEREIFRLLCTVAGIGPTKALQILSACPPGELVEAVRAHDIARLTAVRGVGRKTATRLVTELDGRAGGLEIASGPVHTARQDAVEALVTLGYDRAEAAARVDSAQKRSVGAPLEELVREAVRSG